MTGEKTTGEYVAEADRLLQESLDVNASLQEKAFLVQKAQVNAILALVRKGGSPTS